MAKIKVDDLLPTANVDPERVLRYAAMPSETQPPIQYILGRDGHCYVADGNHRLFAAILRGDPTVTAEPMKIAPEIKNRLLDMFESD